MSVYTLKLRAGAPICNEWYNFLNSMGADCPRAGATVHENVAIIDRHLEEYNAVFYYIDAASADVYFELREDATVFLLRFK